MSYSVIYSTHTDNAVKLASAITSALGSEDLVYDGKAAEVPSFALEADVVFIGFWTTANSCDKVIQDLLENKVDGKKVAIFGSCGFGSDSAHFQEVRGNVLSHLSSKAELLGFYLVNGRIGQSFVQKAIESNGADGEDYHFPSYRKYYKEDEGHPTPEELESCGEWAKALYVK